MKAFRGEEKQRSRVKHPLHVFRCGAVANARAGRSPRRARAAPPAPPREVPESGADAPVMLATIKQIASPNRSPPPGLAAPRRARREWLALRSHTPMLDTRTGRTLLPYSTSFLPWAYPPCRLNLWAVVQSSLRVIAQSANPSSLVTLRASSAQKTLLPAFFCHPPLCPFVALPLRCSGFMLLCPSAPLPLCPSAPVPLCPSAPLLLCPSASSFPCRSRFTHEI